jgi:hypothetical protein
VAIVLKSRNLSLLETSRPVQACNGIAFTLPSYIGLYLNLILKFLSLAVDSSQFYITELGVAFDYLLRSDVSAANQMLRLR